jgi:HME family heavy-metal exporter
VSVDPARLDAYKISLKEVMEAAEKANINTTGGFLDKASQEYLIRNIGRLTTIEELESSVVAYRKVNPVFLKQVGRVGFAPRVKRGDGSVNGSPAVIMSIQKQPGANTIELTKRIEKALEEIRRSLPADVEVHKEIFKQANFIEAAIHNVEEALRDGAIIVAIVLFLFLLNFRTTFITLTAIPLSFIITFLFMKATQMSINTMTLGGLAIAIGELVDDAIVDLENVFRRLKENVLKEKSENPLVVIFHASSEIRNSIVYATLTIMLVFLPFFFLSGVEGRLFQPIGVAYIVSLVASLLVSLTVTPVLCSYLLPNAPFMRKGVLTEEKKDSPLVQWLKKQDLKLLHWTLKHPWKVLTGALVLFLIAISLFPFMGKEFLPPFNEGTATINVLAMPGTSLAESNRLGSMTEKRLLEIPEIASTARRTGRAELDEHAEGVHYSEIDVVFKKSKRSKEKILHDIRDKLSQFPGTVLNIGQPISHRIDHLLSVKVAFRWEVAAYRDGAVAELQVKRRTVRVRVNPEGLHSHLPAGARDPYGYLPAVRYEELFYHR